MKHSHETTAVPSLTERLNRIAAFLPIFEDPAFSFGMWVGGKQAPYMMLSMPEFVLSDPAEAFVRAAHDAGWILADFGWRVWKNGAEARELASRRDALAGATTEQLAKLLTVLVRQDRFVAGSLAEAFDSGLLVAILRRAEVLLREQPAGDR